MRRQVRHGIWALLIAAAGAALVVVAVFTSGGSTPKDRPLSRTPPETVTPRVPVVPKSYTCPQCGSPIEWGSETCPRCGWRPGRFMFDAALNAKAPAGQPEASAAQVASTALPSPREQNAAGKEFIEGHWLGLEVITLTPELAKEYRAQKGETGVLVDEITLEAAESGVLAGDLVQSVGGHPTPDLKAFFLATQRVRDQGQTRVGISRRGGKMTFVIEARNAKELGFAQMEAAQPIRPGSISPHRSRGRPCTDCHVIMRTGGQLPTDAGDILPTPPPIATDAKAPHGYRGRCSVCHVVR